MLLFKKSADLGNYLERLRQEGLAIGFVPTMGALHQGHISLVEQSREESGITVCSIFVNPTQFNDSKDFEKYPSTIEADIDKLEAAGCDVLFLPSVSEIYPDGTALAAHYNLGYLETILEGKFRPGHFQGVCQVVERLLQIVKPHFLFLGQKDYQQCMVIKKLIALTGLPVHTIVCPTLRESDGLAMSSRNMRLNPGERAKAVKISETLSFIRSSIRPGYLPDLKERCRQYLTAEGFKVDYVEIADAETLEPQEYWDGHQPLVALVAAFLNEVRLIDNHPLHP
ncbi:MAG: pantoate--beta-alanine ligase [Ferruginibacter sp.]